VTARTSERFSLPTSSTRKLREAGVGNVPYTVRESQVQGRNTKFGHFWGQGPEKKLTACITPVSFASKENNAEVFADGFNILQRGRAGMRITGVDALATTAELMESDEIAIRNILRNF